MVKRIVIGLVAVAAFAPIWWTDAEAATCVQWRTIGGSSCCTAWSTKGVQVELTFNQDCGLNGVQCQAEVTATAQAGNAVALCKLGDQITRVDCENAVTFVGSTNPVLGCEQDPKHEQDNTGEGGLGHNMGKHGGGCKATIILTPVGVAACAECGDVCGTAGTCVDVTPVEMDTTVNATNAFIPDSDVTLASASTTPNCAGSDCFWEEHCSINPKKIDEVTPVCAPESEICVIPPGAAYQCNLVCVGSGCFSEE